MSSNYVEISYWYYFRGYCLMENENVLPEEQKGSTTDW